MGDDGKLQFNLGLQFLCMKNERSMERSFSLLEKQKSNSLQKTTPVTHSRAICYVFIRHSIAYAKLTLLDTVLIRHSIHGHSL